MARDILTRLGLPPEDVEEGCHLILQHLLMYHVATRRDLDDPATVERVRARGARPRRPARSLPAHGGRPLDDEPDLDDHVEGADARRALPRDRRAPVGPAGRRRARSHACASKCASAWKDAATLSFLDAFMVEHAGALPALELPGRDRRPRRARAQGRRPSRSSPASSRRVTPRPPSSASSPPTARASSPPSPPPSPRAGSRCTPRRSTRDVARRHVQAVDLFWVRDRVDGAEGVPRAMPKLERDLRQRHHRPGQAAQISWRTRRDRRPGPSARPRGDAPRWPSTTAPRRARR